eukprot:365562-Chlamydomonas_euryale.AAC.3
MPVCPALVQKGGLVQRTAAKQCCHKSLPCMSTHPHVCTAARPWRHTNMHVHGCAAMAPHKHECARLRGHGATRT